MSSNKRLFVPLATTAFDWFKRGKLWEIRNLKGQYNLNNVKAGKTVELRKGYNTNDSIWGFIEDVRQFIDIDDLLNNIEYELIIPDATNLSEAKKLLKNFTSEGEKIIAFKIRQNPDLEPRKYTASSLKLLDKFYDAVIEGSKISTIRMGFVFVNDEKITFKFNSKPEIRVKVLKIDYSKKLRDLDKKNAVKDGFDSISNLTNELIKFYPNLNGDSQLTIFEFEVI